MSLERTEENLMTIKLPYIGFTTYILAYGLFTIKFRTNPYGKTKRAKVLRVFVFFLLLGVYIGCIQLFYFIIKDYGYRTKLRSYFFFSFPFVPSLLIFYLLYFLLHRNMIENVSLRQKVYSSTGLPLVIMQLTISLCGDYCFVTLSEKSLFYGVMVCSIYPFVIGAHKALIEWF